MWKSHLKIYLDAFVIVALTCILDISFLMSFIYSEISLFFVNMVLYMSNFIIPLLVS